MSQRFYLPGLAVACSLALVCASSVAGRAQAAPVFQQSPVAGAGAGDPSASTAIAAPQAGTSESGVRLVQVTDVPMPRDSKVDEDASMVIGGGNRWLGRLVLRVRTNAAETYNYYYNGMVRLGWTRMSAIQSKVSMLVFTQGERVASVQIKGGLGGSTVTLVVTTRDMEGG